VRWLFLYPTLLLMFANLVAGSWLLPQPRVVQVLFSFFLSVLGLARK
jgi:hypothetical protein